MADPLDAATIVPSPVPQPHKATYGVIGEKAAIATTPQDMVSASVEGFLLEYQGNTRAAYRRDLTCFITYCRRRGISPLTASRAQIAGYLQEISESGASAATVNRRLASIRGLYRYLVDEGEITSSPAARIRARPIALNRTSPLNPQQVRSLLTRADEIGGRVSALAWLLATTGARISEALTSTVEEIHPTGGSLAALRLSGKGGRSRVVVITDEVMERLRPLVGSRTHGYLFATSHGRSWDRRNATKALADAAARAGVSHFHPHRLRATFVTTARARGCHLADIQDAVGHCDPATTRRYDHWVIETDKHPTLAVQSALTVTELLPFHDASSVAHPRVA